MNTVNCVTFTIGTVGIAPYVVAVSVDVSPAKGDTGRFQLSELLMSEGAAKDTRGRVKLAFDNLGIDLRAYDIEVCTITADAPSFCGRFDLAIAAALLVCLDKVEPEHVRGTAFLGELSYHGGGGHVVQPRAMFAAARGATGFKRLFVSDRCSEEVYRAVESIDASERPSVYPVSTVADMIERLAKPGEAYTPFREVRYESSAPANFAAFSGRARRAAEIAAAGGHPLLLLGRAATVFARSMLNILPEMTRREMDEVNAVHSCAGQTDGHYITRRPFRAPHHTASQPAILGSGHTMGFFTPGEVSLAHNGILHLDEMTEAKISTFQTIPRILSEGIVTLHRGQGQGAFPANTLIVAGAHRCLCGYKGTTYKPCTCSEERISGHLDRIERMGLGFDLRVEIDPPASDAAAAQTETPAQVRDRVTAARERQAARAHAGAPRLNAFLMGEHLKSIATPDSGGAKVLEDASTHLSLTAVERVNVLRVARTIADLDASDTVRAPHVAEALTYIRSPR